MIPHTYPSELNPYSDMSEMKVYYLSSISGLVRWTDYIPVQTTYWDEGIEGTTDATGYQAIQTIASTTGLSAWSDYVPVYEDGAATVPWTTDANGYIPIGFSESGVLSFLDNAEFIATLTHSLVLDEGTGSPTFTRATTATVTDNEGILRTAIAGEARFVGARRVRNLATTSSENFDASPWVKTATTVAASAVEITGVASVFDLTETTANSIHTVNIPISIVSGNSYIFHLRAKAGTRRRFMLREGSSTGAGATFDLISGTVAASESGGTGAIEDLGDGVYLCSVKYTAIATGAHSFYAYTMQDGTAGNAQATFVGAADKYVTIGGFQLEDITGRTDQTTPSEYVSVGVLSAPYHGAGVDGVEYFNTDLTGAALPTSYTYDAVSLNGVAGTYVSTPDSVANSITGDIDIRFVGAATDWTPGAYVGLVTKDNGATQRSYSLWINTSSGDIDLAFSLDGASGILAQFANPTPAFVDGSPYGLRVTRVASTGAVTLYKSLDLGITWEQVGVPVMATAGALFDSTTAVAIGGRAIGDIPFSGRIYQAQIYNGIDGTLAVDFNAARYAGGTTLTGSTGETWTLNGSAVIHPTNYPNLGYLAEAAGTNLIWPSNDLTNAQWTKRGTATAVKDATGPDGVANSATTCVVNTSAGPNDIFYTTALTGLGAGTSGVAAFWIKKTTASGTLRLQNASDATRGQFDINLASLGSGWEKITNQHAAVTVNSQFSSAAGGTVQLQFFAQAGGPLTFAVYGMEYNTGVTASGSTIVTTTVAVTRNADVLTYPSAGNVSDTVGSAYAELTSNLPTATQINILSSFTAVGGHYIYIDNSPSQLSIYDGTTDRNFIAVSQPLLTPTKMGTFWGDGACNGALSGTLGTARAFDGSMSGGANIGVGCLPAGGGPINGTIRNVRIFQRALSSSELQAITR